MPAIDTLPHPATGAVNPTVVHVQQVQQSHGSRFTHVTFGSAGGMDGDPHTVVNEHACRAMFRRGLRPIVGGMVMCPADVD